MIPVLYLGPHNQWDQVMVRQLFADQLYHHGIGFTEVAEWPDAEGLVLVVPGRYWYDKIDLDINPALKRYEWVLGIRTGDEEDLFDIDVVEHPNIQWWVQTPRPNRDYGSARRFGVGYSPAFATMPPEPPAAPDFGYFLSAQNNHGRRADFFRTLGLNDGAEVQVGPDSLLAATGGFTQGLAPDEYCEYMENTKVAPAPSGPWTPDTFRAYEAMQAHTVPIVDDIATYHPIPGYWKSLYPDAPFPILTDLENLPGWINDVSSAWPTLHNKVTAWWMLHKRSWTHWLREDLTELGVDIPSPDELTVVVPTSPVPSHPGTEILEETIDSIRYHFPHAEILLCFDGVRPEQDHRREDYREYTRRALWLADHCWGNVTPILFDTHQHQTGMMRTVLDSYLDTRLVLYVEHDTPLVTDCPIDWGTIMNRVRHGEFHSVRLYHEGVVPEPHLHMMHGRSGEFLCTSQWSQRPHVSTSAFYRRVIGDYFRSDAREFIEDRMHGVVETAAREDGLDGWQQWRLAIYAPEDGLGNYKRSYHVDGRAGEDKYD